MATCKGLRNMKTVVLTGYVEALPLPKTLAPSVQYVQVSVVVKRSMLSKMSTGGATEHNNLDQEEHAGLPRKQPKATTTGMSNSKDECASIPSSNPSPAPIAKCKPMTPSRSGCLMGVTNANFRPVPERTPPSYEGLRLQTARAIRNSRAVFPPFCSQLVVFTNSKSAMLKFPRLDIRSNCLRVNCELRLPHTEQVAGFLSPEDLEIWVLPNCITMTMNRHTPSKVDWVTVSPNITPRTVKSRRKGSAERTMFCGPVSEAHHGSIFVNEKGLTDENLTFDMEVAESHRESDCFRVGEIKTPTTEPPHVRRIHI
ncbi:hypothetical protein HCBG_03268 [Histoplasma capsulatum G186AR]|uniref:Uncharacterized protein n=1 Tax=Ajellomyces capsulatus (strain G186AR / H82 / ATCC MYA-2454 / RMSCC 2432) TaxID=447093 RepID=C0NJD8_AJECG|nr:uncharacterized protein HCBG_03268 [Histoplasma capsulatum G186AR]EEH07979.1 hypothetical protein HCBG_03268 [Histoplasma capsulatum G186AR]